MSNRGRDHVSYFSVLYGNLSDKILVNAHEYYDYYFTDLKTMSISRQRNYAHRSGNVCCVLSIKDKFSQDSLDLQTDVNWKNYLLTYSITKSVCTNKCSEFRGGELLHMFDLTKF